MARVFRLSASVVVWFGLVLQFYLITRGRSGADLASVIVNYFSYFTILSNILCALALTLPWLAPNSPPGRFFASAQARGGIALYIAITGAIYVTILQSLWSPTGLQWLADVLLHYATPILFLADWLAFTPRVRLAWSAAVTWLGFPLAFCAWCLLHGRLSGFYPYPFIDVAHLGLARAAANMVGLAVLFLILGLLLVLAERLLAGRITASGSAGTGAGPSPTGLESAPSAGGPPRDR